MVGNICFNHNQANQLLSGLWFSDDIIDVYLLLCGYFQPDIKFLPTSWYSSCSEIGEKRLRTSWVSWPFSPFFHGSFEKRLMRSNAKIFKDATDVSAAMNEFTAVITVMNYCGNHWITIQFDPKRLILNVFNILQPQNLSRWVPSMAWVKW